MDLIRSFVLRTDERAAAKSSSPNGFCFELIDDATLNRRLSVNRSFEVQKANCLSGVYTRENSIDGRKPPDVIDPGLERNHCVLSRANDFAIHVKIVTSSLPLHCKLAAVLAIGIERYRINSCELTV